MDSVRQEFSKKILLPVSILFFFLSCHVNFPSIDRKALFLFCNVILLFVTTHSIAQVDETAKTDASPNYSKMEDVEIEPCLVEETAAATTAAEIECSTNLTEPEKVVQLEKPETDDAGSPPSDDLVGDGEEDESMRFKIFDDERDVEDQQRDELQEKIEAFIEKVKRQRRMEVLQSEMRIQGYE